MNISQRISQVQQQLNTLSSSINDSILSEQLNALATQLAQIARDTGSTEISKSATSDAPELKNGCYIFAGQKGFYCPSCFDRDGTKAITTRINSKLRVCSICRISIK